MNDDLALAYEMAILATLGPSGRLISASKTLYRDAHPDHVLVFNANLCTRAGKFWWGDLDLTSDEPTLIELTARIGEIVHVLHESDGRFEHGTSHSSRRPCTR